LEIVAYDISSIADTVSKSQGGTFDNDITVGGTVTADGLTVDQGGTATINLASGAGSWGMLAFGDPDDADVGRFFYDHGSNALTTRTTATNRMQIAGNGDISFYEDTGTTPKFFWDASAESLGIGTTSPSTKLHSVDSNGNVLRLQRDGAFTGSWDVDIGSFSTGDFTIYDNENSRRAITIDKLSSFTGNSAMRIDSSGHVYIGKTTTTIADAGIFMQSTGGVDATRDGVVVLSVNRLSSDGDLVAFLQDTVQEGTISVSGTAVSYNGGHLARWSQTADKTRIDGLLKGTVLSNLDEMCEWFRVEFEYQRLVSEAIEAKDAVLDEEGNVIEEAVAAQDAIYETRTTSEAYDGTANVGDVIDWEYEGQTVQATVIREDNEQLNRMKVSDVEGDQNVAGVFVNWDDDDDTNTADMNIAMTGDMIIRIAQGVTVQRGDLLMSAGDGTAKPQGDDIVRSKTIAKVTSTHVTYTYDDGSYCVPCVLMAC
jgi:hypothetical protein